MHSVINDVNYVNPIHSILSYCYMKSIAHMKYRKKKQPIPVDISAVGKKNSSNTSSHSKLVHVLEEASKCTYIIFGGGNTVAIKCAR